MGGPRTSVQVLLLSVVGAICLSTFVSANANITLAPASPISENSKTTGSQDNCHTANLQNASHRISAAVDTLTAELSCKRGNGTLSEDKSQELEQNLRQIVELTVKVFFDLTEVVEQLTPNQKAELILDPQNDALQNETIVREVLTSLTESPDGDQLNQFFQAFADISKQKNITHIMNPAVRDTILNLTLTGLAPEFGDFKPEDYKLWFQVNLATVLASLSPDSLVVIPSNISCASYAAILTGLQQSLTSLPLDLSQGVRSSVKSQLEQTPSTDNSPGALCNFTITAQACSSVPNSSFPSSSFALEALGEVKIANFSQAQLQNNTFVSSWFQTKLRPFLASPSRNFLSCLSSRNFSCQTYQTILAVSPPVQVATNLTQNNLVTLMKCSLESQTTYPVEVWKLFFQKATPAIDEALDSLATMVPNSSFPSSSFALEALGEVKIANFSQAQLQNNTFDESLSVLTPAQVAQLTLSSLDSNDTDQIDRVFERLEQGNALENVDEFLTELAANCRQGIESDAQWLESNLGPFSTQASYADLKVFNLSVVAVVDSLSANQKAELILDPQSGALENETIVREVLTSLTESPDGDQLNQFFQAFADISKQKNITHIMNPAVRDTILNLTLTGLAPEFGDFKPEDYKLWFQVNLATVLASLSPDSLVVIPSNISCASYAAILTGLQQSLTSLPLDLSQGVRSSVKSLKERFPRCSLADSFLCKETPVDEDLICAPVNGSQLEQTPSTDNSPGALCNFTITAHACSSATNLTQNNLVTLMKCSLESQTTYPVEVWKLFFQKATPAIDEALDSLATMALGEVKIANFSQAQLQNNTFVSSWFQTKLRPFLASPSRNFLSCLSSRNFSCQTYQTAFSSQRPSMDREKAQAVYNHFIKPFLSRNDSSDPGCVSSSAGSKEWLQENLRRIVSVLTPAQVAQLTLSSLDSNDTDQIDHVFDRLEQGNALENVDEFLTELAASEQEPEFQPVVRDRVMNRTFAIISPHFPQFKVSGLGKVFPAIPLLEQQAITAVLLDYLRESGSVINEPGGSGESLSANQKAELIWIHRVAHWKMKPLHQQADSPVSSKVDVPATGPVTGCEIKRKVTQGEIPRCSLADSFLVTTGTNPSTDNSPGALCNFTITAHACSSATNLTQNNLVTLMKCSLESQTTYPVEIPNSSFPSSSFALEALGEVKIANFSQAELQNNTFVSSWFQTKLRPFWPLRPATSYHA
ncbi:hypothetical protein INR49_003066 [Caranx melampygus]|nr:hypothetical protein INR49_003066 [Caranx melampygus]